MRIFKRVMGLRKPKINIKPKDPKASKESKPGFGKKRELKKSVENIVKKKEIDSWPLNGQVISKPLKYHQTNRYVSVYHDILRKEPINHLIKTKNKTPSLLVLGPGIGQDISYLKNELSSNGINPKIDVLGLQKTIEPKLLEKKIVNKDFSSGLSLEEISSNPIKNKKLISNLKGKYDMVVGSASVGLHTLYPAFNVFNTSMLLKKKGVAYVEIPTKRTLTSNFNFGIPEKHLKRIIAQTERLPEIVTRFLETQGGKNFSQEFKFSNIDYYEPRHSNLGVVDNSKLHIRYIKIERK